MSPGLSGPGSPAGPWEPVSLTKWGTRASPWRLVFRVVSPVVGSGGTGEKRGSRAQEELGRRGGFRPALGVTLALQRGPGPQVRTLPNCSLFAATPLTCMRQVQPFRSKKWETVISAPDRPLSSEPAGGLVTDPPPSASQARARAPNPPAVPTGVLLSRPSRDAGDRRRQSHGPPGE